MTALLETATGHVCIGSTDGYDMALWTALPDPPGEVSLYILDQGTRTWVEDVAGERARLIDGIKGQRDAAFSDGCDTPLGRVQTDPGSRDAINAAVTGAITAKITGQPFAAEWTMADNSIVAHDADAMLALGAAVLTCIGVTQAAYEAKRAALNAATTLAALWVIVPAGPPPVAA